jgi:hypothetical protein
VPKREPRIPTRGKSLMPHSWLEYEQLGHIWKYKKHVTAVA